MNVIASKSDRERNIVRMGHAISKANGGYARAERLAGLNSYEAKVLYALVFDDGMTQREICDVYDMPKQTVNNIVRRLVSKGLALANASEGNRKNKPVYLTQKGAAYAEELLAPLNEFEFRVMDEMGEDAYVLLVELTEQYADAIEKVLSRGCLHRSETDEG